ncbi:PhzF family phenazine biosynthesis protein [Marinimicrococcus flavescens]|uniref:PhzF family phenazine biosynthesis protein n=1 Tax=Marinimicrococcus flavescens TaxID=3031815 RepID=A0AAP3XQV2_9PROT|nr:PhzF family phenazine biosynthesis protein [Marinimicrococcus flavescens]
MRYRFLTTDVFTDRRFGGNPLAVLPEASGLSTEQMQAVAAEFNYSETTFVLPPEDPAGLCHVRIFTPKGEMPFAGHPTVGTALVLARLDRVPRPDGEGRSRFVLEEQAGPVPVTVFREDGEPVRAELEAPARPSLGGAPAVEKVAAWLALDPGEIVAGPASPRIASCGAAFLVVEVANLAVLGQLRPPPADAALDGGHGVFLFSRDVGGDAADLRARMFAPAHGIAEDPATGSAAAACAGLLAAIAGEAEGTFSWRIAQGVEMGRPSLIETRAEKRGGEVVAVHVAGGAVPVSEGWIEV